MNTNICCIALHKSAQWNAAVIRGKSLLIACDRTRRAFPRRPATAAVAVPAVAAAIASRPGLPVGNIYYRLPGVILKDAGTTGQMTGQSCSNQTVMGTVIRRDTDRTTGQRYSAHVIRGIRHILRCLLCLQNSLVIEYHAEVQCSKRVR